jgi:hypothetical protein
MFHDVVKQLERIFYILGTEKSDLDEVAEVMFLVAEWSLELIICLLYVLKNDFCEVDETMLQGVERPCQRIFCILGIKKATWTKLLK